MINEALSVLVRKAHLLPGIDSNHGVLTGILKFCATRLDVKLGKSLHGLVIKLGDGSCQLVSKALLNMYAKCGSLGDFEEYFRQMDYRDTVTWNIVLSGFSGSRSHDAEVMKLFCAMHLSGEPKPSDVTLAIVLPVCSRNRYLGAGESLHGYSLKCGFESHTLVGNALLSMYAKCGHIACASSVFHEILDKDVVSWNAIIAGCLENELPSDAFQLFLSMLKGPIQPNYATIASVLPIFDCVGGTHIYKLGKQIHCYVLQRPDLFSEITVLNALLSFYLRFGQTKEAESLFRKMKFKDLVSWNSLIAGYVSNRNWLKAVGLFHELVNIELIRPDPVTLISTLSACGQLNDINLGKQIHGFVIRNCCLQEDSKVQNALISLYAKHGYTKAALQTFLLTPIRDLISWNTILDACKENRFDNEFYYLLQWMFREGIKPDSIVLLTIIQFCATLARTDFVKEAHAFLIRYTFLFNEGEPNLGNALIEAYAKCGLIVYASKMFNSFAVKRNVETCNSIISGSMICGSLGNAHARSGKISDKDITTWNLMVQAYADNDCPDQALSLIQELQFYGMKPDNMTIMNFLPVCVQTSSVHMLKQCHGYVFRSCFEDFYLNAALLDAYSKCGSPDSAYKLFQSTREKDLVMFTSMVGGYAMHGMGIDALKIYYNMLELGLQPDNVLMTTVLSACSHAGLIKEGLEIFDSIEKVHKLKPTIEQYSCLVDLLARGGRLKDAYHIVNQMPIEANATIWGALLGGCKNHDDVNIRNVIAGHLFEDKSTDIGNYVVISNMYAENGRWDGVQGIRKLMRTKDLKKHVGCSWIEVDRKKTSFAAAEFSHPQSDVIARTIRELHQQIKALFEI